MKLLIVSDSHGAAERIERALAREKPDMLLHLGDGWRDVGRVLRGCPGLLVRQVPGNCDFQEDVPPEALLELEGCRLLLCHGHTYGVKRSLNEAAAAAERMGLHGFFFGHTHRPLVERWGRTLFLNPGSIGCGPRPTYAVATAEQGRLEGRSVYLDPQ